MKLRLIFSIFIFLAALIFAGYMIYQWVRHGMPIYAAAYKSDSRPEILPFLSWALISGLVFFVAAFDVFTHIKSNQESTNILKKRAKKITNAE